MQAMAQVGGLVLLTDEVGGNKESFFFAGVDKVSTENTLCTTYHWNAY